MDCGWPAFRLGLDQVVKARRRRRDRVILVADRRMTPRQIGRAKAFDLRMGGRPISTREAERSEGSKPAQAPGPVRLTATRLAQPGAATSRSGWTPLTDSAARPRPDPTPWPRKNTGAGLGALAVPH